MGTMTYLSAEPGARVVMEMWAWELAAQARAARGQRSAVAVAWVAPTAERLMFPLAATVQVVAELQPAVVEEAAAQVVAELQPAVVEAAAVPVAGMRHPISRLIVSTRFRYQPGW